MNTSTYDVTTKTGAGCCTSLRKVKDTAVRWFHRTIIWFYSKGLIPNITIKKLISLNQLNEILKPLETQCRDFKSKPFKVSLLNISTDYQQIINLLNKINRIIPIIEVIRPAQTLSENCLKKDTDDLDAEINQRLVSIESTLYDLEVIQSQMIDLLKYVKKINSKNIPDVLYEQQFIIRPDISLCRNNTAGKSYKQIQPKNNPIKIERIKKYLNEILADQIVEKILFSISRISSETFKAHYFARGGDNSIASLPDGSPSRWSFYFSESDDSYRLYEHTEGLSFNISDKAANCILDDIKQKNLVVNSALLKGGEY